MKPPPSFRNSSIILKMKILLGESLNQEIRQFEIVRNFFKSDYNYGGGCCSY